MVILLNLLEYLVQPSIFSEESLVLAIGFMHGHDLPG